MGLCLLLISIWQRELKRNPLLLIVLLTFKLLLSLLYYLCNLHKGLEMYKELVLEHLLDIVELGWQ